MELNRIDIFNKISTMIIVSLVSLFLAPVILHLLSGINSFNLIIEMYLNKTTENSVELKANAIIMIMLTIFLLGYLLFTIFMTIVEILYWEKDQKYNENKLRYQKKYYGIFTFAVVLFGFIPLITALLNETEEVKDNVIHYFIAMSSLFLYPYLYLVRIDGNTENGYNTEQKMARKMIMLIIDFTSSLFFNKLNFQHQSKEYNILMASFFFLVSATILLVISGFQKALSE